LRARTWLESRHNLRRYRLILKVALVNQMIPPQTLQVFMGVLVAWFYFFTVLTTGMLSLAALIGRKRSAAVRARIGLFGLLWLGFVLGQGILGMLWLVLSLAGMLQSWLIWIVCAVEWFFLGCMTVFVLRHHAVQLVRPIGWASFLSFREGRPWYLWCGIAIVIVGALRGLIALVPPYVDDALRVYLVHARMIAESHTLKLQPFTSPFFALPPLQVEMHWAALFALSNETAVTVWDYLCALSFLSGIGLLAWSLTSSRRVAFLAVLMMLSTPGFYEMIGGGKTDNAAAQYGMAAFLCLTLWPALERRAVILAGLCVGWAMAGRYTNVIIFPALIVFTIMVIHHSWKLSDDMTIKQLKRAWITNSLLGFVFAGFAGAPMLIKNWLLVGCPLAPVLGCQETFWAHIYAIAHFNRQNISLVDLVFFPFIWTFAAREDMLGNISPLFIGFFPFLLISGSSGRARAGLTAGLAGLVSLATWFVIHPLLLYTRWLLVPLGLLAVPLSASVIDVEQRLGHDYSVRRLIRTGIGIILLFLLFQSRGIVHSIRYVASTDSRADRWDSMPGHDVAAWLNTQVRPGQRVAFGGWSGYPYFVSPYHLLNSESAEELQWLWEHYGSVSSSFQQAGLWNLYARNGFAYVIVAKDRVDDALSVWPGDIARARPRVAFVGRKDAVLRMEKQEKH
jgi:hypothetical protein